MYLLFALPVLLALLPGFCPAQSALQPSFYNHVINVTSGPDSAAHLLIFGGNDVEGSPQVYAQRILPDGSTQTALLLNEGVPLNFDVLPVSDGYLVVAALFQCDIILPWQLSKLDWDGNVQWKQDLDFFFGPFDTVKLLPGPGAMFWLIHPYSLPKLYTADGVLSETGPFSLSAFDGLRITPANRQLVYGANGLALYNSTLLSYQFALKDQHLLGAEALPDGHFIALSSDTLYRLDGDFAIQLTAPLHLGVSPNLKMTLAGGQIRILSLSSPHRLLRFDTATLTLLETINIPDDAPFQPQALLGIDDRLLLAGNEHYLAGSSTQVVVARTFPAADIPDFSATADAALEELVLPVSPVGMQLPPAPLVPAYSIRLDSAYVIVKNKGATVLNTITVNSVFGSINWLCGTEEAQYRQTFSNLNLAPGDTLHLDLGAIQRNVPGILPPSISICFWTTLPNDSLDADRSNNITCRTASVTISTHEPRPAVRDLAIQPNPVVGTAVFHWENDPFADAEVQVYDLAGRLERSVHTTGFSWTFDRQQTPSGIYTVLVRNAAGQLFAGQLVLR